MSAFRSSRRPTAFAALLLAALAGCSSRGDDPAAITADDQRQLNQAAAILDANSADSNAGGAHESSPHD